LEAVRGRCQRAHCAIASRIARLVNWRTWRDWTKDAFVRRASGGTRRDAIFICQRTSRCSRARGIRNEQPLAARCRIEVQSLRTSRTAGLKVEDSRLISFGPFSLVSSWRATPFPSYGSANARNTRCSCSASILESYTRLVSRRLHFIFRCATLFQIALFDERWTDRNSGGGTDR